MTGRRWRGLKRWCQTTEGRGGPTEEEEGEEAEEGVATIQPGTCTGVDRKEIWGWGLTIFSLTLPTWDGLVRKGISSEPMREEDTGGDFFFLSFFLLLFSGDLIGVDRQPWKCSVDPSRKIYNSICVLLPLNQQAYCFVSKHKHYPLVFF